MKTSHSISIWFFTGISLFANGCLILVAGILEIMRPASSPEAVYQHHANIWWGAVLALVGAGYLIYFSPKKGRE